MVLISFIKFRRFLSNFTEFSWVLPGLTCFHSVLRWFYWVLPSFLWPILIQFSFMLMNRFTRFLWILLGFTENYRVSRSFTGFTGFYRFLLGFTGFYWVLLGFTVFF